MKALVLLLALALGLPAISMPATLFASYQISFDKTPVGGGMNTIAITVRNGAGSQVLGTKTLNNIPDGYPLVTLLDRVLLELKSRALHNATVADMPASNTHTISIIDLATLPDVAED